jgi:hypothetical protein
MTRDDMPEWTGKCGPWCYYWKQAWMGQVCIFRGITRDEGLLCVVPIQVMRKDVAERSRVLESRERAEAAVLDHG